MVTLVNESLSLQQRWNPVRCLCEYYRLDELRWIRMSSESKISSQYSVEWFTTVGRLQPQVSQALRIDSLKGAVWWCGWPCWMPRNDVDEFAWGPEFLVLEREIGHFVLSKSFILQQRILLLHLIWISSNNFTNFTTNHQLHVLSLLVCHVAQFNPPT